MSPTLLVSALRATQSQVKAPAQLAGCYSVSIGIWSPNLGSDSARHAIPASVRLETGPAQSGNGWRLTPFKPDVGANASSRSARWEMADGDVRLTWTDRGTTTIAQLIPVEGKGLTGEVLAPTDSRLVPSPNAVWWSKEPPGPRAPAVLEPRPCSGGNYYHAHRDPWTIDRALASRVAGCYELVDGPWRTDSAMARIHAAPRGPVRFELSKIADPDQTRLAAYDLKTYFEVHSTNLFSTWVRVSDTQPQILISRPLPMAGFALRVTLGGTDLVGSIRAFTDFVAPDGKNEAEQPVRARRVSCSLLR